MCLGVRGTKPEDLDVEAGISLAEGLVFLLVVFKNALEVPYTLVLPLSIRPLRGSVLRPPSLRDVRIQHLFQTVERALAYRKNRRRGVLISVLSLSLRSGLVGRG